MATMTPHIMDRRLGAERRSASTTHSTHSRSHSSMSTLDWVALALMIVGGVNWGLVGLFNVDLVASLFGEMTPISRAVYTAVGLSALYSLYTATKMSRHD